MGTRLFNVGEEPSHDFLEALASEEPDAVVAQRFHVTHQAIRYRRNRLFPGRVWETNRKRKARLKSAPPVAPVLRELEQIKGSLQHLDEEELVELLLAVDARLLELEVKAETRRVLQVVQESQLARVPHRAA